MGWVRWISIEWKLFIQFILACHMALISWNPVFIGADPVDDDPKQLSSTKSELYVIISWVMVFFFLIVCLIIL